VTSNNALFDIYHEMKAKVSALKDVLTPRENNVIVQMSGSNNGLVSLFSRLSVW